jgi:GH18 family chitinase
MNKSPRFFMYTALLFAIAFPAFAQFKIIGYVPDWSGSPTYVQYDKLTHINYAFVLPSNGTGGLSAPDSGILSTLVSQGHSHGVKVLVSIGGWNNGDDSRFHAVAANQTYINTFVANCTTMVSKFNLDGIDIDWEYPDAGASADQYVTFMTALANALHPKARLLTAAVVGTANSGVKNAIFDVADFLNIMSYDGGTPHSPYTMAVSDLHSWRVRGLAKEKAILGVPFYGRDPYTSYADLCKADASAPTKDQVGNIYYNGIPTMQKKTQLAADSGGGIMIWELSQDVSGANSLLKAIYDKAPKTQIAFEHAVGLSNNAGLLRLMQNYPNPARTSTIIPLHFANAATASVDIIDVQGRMVRKVAGNAAFSAGTHNFSWDVRNENGIPVPAGVYQYRAIIHSESGDQAVIRQMAVVK